MSLTAHVDKKLVYVAMSGGVDSSVAAALLKRRGFGVVGVFMKPYQPNAGISNFPACVQRTGRQFPISNKIPNSKLQNPSSNFCLWKQDREDAMRAASVLGVPLLTWDYSKEYKKEVVNHMVREYKDGKTPNPDVMCNKEIKFGLFLSRALKEGADYIATGHYIKRQATSDKRQVKLLQAKDQNKDQSYFLWTLTQKQLKYCLFPIGDYTKPEVRKMAKRFGLPNHNKKDSQGVCFVGKLNMKDFLKKHIKPKKGKIVLCGHYARDTHVIGEHDGVYYYTIGQRHGLNIKNGQGPYFVIGKDVTRNIIYVANEKVRNKQQKTSMIARSINWIAREPELSEKVDIKIRYRSKTIPATLLKECSSYRATALPHYKLTSITPGQSAVFYKGKEMLGGGIIEI